MQQSFAAFGSAKLVSFLKVHIFGGCGGSVSDLYLTFDLEIPENTSKRVGEVKAAKNCYSCDMVSEKWNKIDAWMDEWMDD